MNKLKTIFLIICIIGATLLLGCFAQQKLPTLSTPSIADGGLGFIRTLGLVGIGAVMFFACWNSMKVYIAAIIGIGTTVALTTICMHYEKWFALVMCIAIGTVVLSAIASLFVKHKGIFLAWRE